MNNHIIDILRVHKEKLDSCLEKENKTSSQKLYNYISETDDEARERITKKLSNDVLDLCHEYYVKNNNEKLKNSILYLFGKDEGTKVSCIKSIYDKMMQVNKSNTETSNNSLQGLFSAITFQELCPKCRGIDGVYKSYSFMKDFAEYEMKKSPKQSKLEFTTKRNGMWMNIKIMAPCPSCSEKFDDLNEMKILTWPRIENLESHKYLLISDCVKFIEDVIYPWIDSRNFCKTGSVV